MPSIDCVSREPAKDGPEQFVILSHNRIRREFQDGEIVRSVPQLRRGVQVECLIHTVLGKCVNCLME